MRNYTYKTTIFACFSGYVVQAVVNNFVPLLFVTFQSTYAIPLPQIALLVAVNFGVQLLVDFLATFFVDKVGYRPCIVLAQFCAALGLLLLAVLPEIIDPFAGILTAVVVYAIGGGLIEVLISPIMESCPTDNKEKAMSLLHSFYCWGHVGVVLISTLFFFLVGVENWRILACIWVIIPICNAFLFAKVPMAPLIAEGEEGMNYASLFRSKVFWLLLVMMLCAGAAEQSISQWASAFAEKGLGISKAAGDLAGPMSFAVLMGLSRLLYGKFGDRIQLDKCMLGSSILCVFAFLLVSVVPSPVINLIGCALGGLAVGIMWPGSMSTASLALRNGGTAMFALMALAGDLGCSVGPTLVGFVSEAAGDNLKAGLLAGILFPAVMALCLFFGTKRKALHK